MRLQAITTAFIFCLCAAVSATRPAPSKSKIETFAGVGQAGYAGDGGQATQAMKAGTIHHVAGTGEKGFTGNGGAAKLATLSGPKGLSVAPNGNVYLADTESHSIRMIDVRKNTIELIAGTGAKGDGADGDPLACQMSRPHGVFVDRDGSIFIGDSEAHRVRVIRISTSGRSERGWRQ